jgi:hypothetical protein
MCLNTYHGLNDVPVDAAGTLVGLNRDGVVVDKSSAVKVNQYSYNSMYKKD